MPDRDAATVARAVLAASERVLAGVGACRPAGLVQDARRIHDAAGRLERLLVEAGAAGTGPRRGVPGPRHELNNALNHILGYGELLLEEGEAEPLRADLTALVEAARELRALVARGGPAPAGGPPARGGAASGSEGGTVLVVDDDPVNRALLTRCLAPAGHEVLAMEHGQWALEILESERIDAILLDLEMPRMDGYQTLERLKADPRTRDIPVIVVSGSDAEPTVIRCFELGAEDFVAKPFSAVLLGARVAASVTRKRLREREQRYLHDVGLVTEAAAAIETGTFLPETLDRVATRDDELGRLARVVQRMARLLPPRRP